MLSFCAPGPRMSRTSCELCLAKDRKIAALELRLIDLLESDRKIAACDEKIAACDEELKQLEEQSDEVAACVSRKLTGMEGAPKRSRSRPHSTPTDYA